jgi:uncharacterized protein CbrC (UPF0167 family)
MDYRYFQDPHSFSTYTDEKQLCVLCNQEGPGYKGPFYGRQRIAFVCEDCLLAGKRATVEGFTNTWAAATLREQLEILRPELDETEVKRLVEERSAELKHRTPHLVTWQDFTWPVHCGDYCRFIKELGKPDLNELAPDGDGQEFFRQHLPEDQRAVTDVPSVWDAIRPDSPNDNATPYSVGVYLFQCLECKEHMIFWDCD